MSNRVGNMGNKINFLHGSGGVNAIPSDSGRRFAAVKTGSLREVMPETTAFIDSLRAVFGADAINPSIKAGMNGQPTFWARENGIEVGTYMGEFGEGAEV